MPKGPNGERRKADVIGNAVLVAQIATGEAKDSAYLAPAKKNSGAAGGAARSASLSTSERSAIAKRAAAARWS